MAVMYECPNCRYRNSIKNIKCKRCEYSIRKSPNKAYWINYRDSTGKLRFERIGASKQAAENREREVKTSIVEGRYIDKNMNTKFTLKRLIEWYTELTDTKSKKSCDRIKQVLIHIERVIRGDVLISQLQPSMMKKYKKTRLKDSSTGRKKENCSSCNHQQRDHIL